MTEVIDAHHHLWPEEAIAAQSWQPQHQTTLRRAFAPEDLRADLGRAGVTGTVLMQSVDSPQENDRLLAYAATADFVRGVVAWAPLDRPAEVADVVTDLRSRSTPGRAAVVGVRCLIGADPMTWALDGDALTMFRLLADTGLAWDVVPVTQAQRDVVVRVAEAVPALRIVVDHLAAPPLDPADADRWRAGVERLAALPNIAIKLSVGVAVLHAASSWVPEQVAGWVLDALAAFGPQRSMLGSNWPVVLLLTDYASAWGDALAAVRTALPADDVGSVVASTATRWYGLGQSRE